MNYLHIRFLESILQVVKNVAQIHTQRTVLHFTEVVAAAVVVVVAFVDGVVVDVVVVNALGRLAFRIAILTQS